VVAPAFLARISRTSTTVDRERRFSFRILQLNRRIRTRATVTLRNAAGLSSTASKQITLKAPNRRALHLRRRAYTTVKSVDVASRP
jgi:hypothetical protein